MNERDVGRYVESGQLATVVFELYVQTFNVASVSLTALFVAWEKFLPCSTLFGISL